MEPSFVSKEEISAWRKWAQTSSPAASSNLIQSQWETILTPSAQRNSPYQTCSSCRRIR